MKIKNSKLEYWVFYYRNDKTNRINILDGEADYIATNIKRGKIKDRKELKEYLTKEFKYYYWGKTENEFLIRELFDEAHKDKIDIWFQIEPNINMITDYVIYKMEIEF